MKKVTIELSDEDVEEGVTLLHRATEVLERLEHLADDLEELRYMVVELEKIKGGKK